MMRHVPWKAVYAGALLHFHKHVHRVGNDGAPQHRQNEVDHPQQEPGQGNSQCCVRNL